MSSRSFTAPAGFASTASDAASTCSRDHVAAGCQVPIFCAATFMVIPPAISGTHPRLARNVIARPGVRSASRLSRQARVDVADVDLGLGRHAREDRVRKPALEHVVCAICRLRGQILRADAHLHLGARLERAAPVDAGDRPERGRHSKPAGACVHGLDRSRR